MRNLVTIRTVSQLVPIKDADRIELAIIDGWQCVVNKGEFQPNSLGVFFEIDSILPASDPRFAFMEKSKWRVRSRKLKGQVSQGLLLPLNQFTVDELADLSLIGVTKYEPPLPSEGQGEQKGTFPSFVPKTDQERVQNIPAILESFNFIESEITEKLDGSSFTCWFNEGATGLASRNWEIKPDVSGWYSNVFNKYDLGTKLAALGRNIAIQGEILGPGIQGNKYKLTELDLFVFDVYDIDMRRYMSPSERVALVDQLGLKHVPIIPFTFLSAYAPFTVESLLAAADGKSYIHPEADREGLVFKGFGDRRSFKVISNKWLLANE